MNRLASIFLVVTLALSASGCSQTPTRAAIRLDASAPTARTPRQQIVAKIAPRCPTPTQWTRDQKRLVGNYLVAHSDEPALGLLAPEWERLDEGARACRR